jgi:Ca2+-binding EF-hand superfamily protein
MKLQQAIMTFIASHVIMNQDHPHYLIDFFRKLDKDQDGKISREELKTEFYKLLDPKDAEIEVDKILQESGCTGDFLEYTNFLAGTTDKSTLITPTNLEAAFRMLDLDGDGSISEGELRSVFKLEDREAENELLSDLNKSGKYKLDIERFKNIMLN